MKRRDFIKLTSVFSAGAALPLFPSMNLFASHGGYAGPLFLMLDARGGWDPTSLCDPKGYTSPTDSARINNYPTANIQTQGNINYAPPPDSFLPGGANFNANLYSAADFFRDYGNKLLIINGLDCRTNSHSNGTQFNWSGELRRSGYPSFGALLGGTLGAGSAMPFITNGGYSFGGGLTVPIRLNSSGQNVLFEVARPNNTAPRSNNNLYHDVAVASLIKNAKDARTQAMLGQTGASNEQRLLRVRTSIQQWVAADTGRDHLVALADNLEDVANIYPPFTRAGEFNNRGNADNLYQQGRLALAAYQEGVTVAAHISMGGFDTHGDHDARHYPRLMDFIKGIDAILKEADRRNLLNRLVLVIGSDFARTNKYNNDNGKDHWSIGSTMFMGNGPDPIVGTGGQVIVGNRVVGATDASQRAVDIDPATLAPDTNGIRITPAHLHRQLREFSGVDGQSAATQFVLSVPDSENLVRLFTG